ncbi:rRNA maturation RNase YbeY [Labrys wisconsinensis]|uniref:Endoribonuclease YbeY n=1 Tax=Labrys wisconsinensis TaxID=425677 RepID=A0ABU0JGJ5_9HYPH|nr:rRNA maturation RNase YbeY [Labrys wisconsinensis]MDQ0472364.1 putative rRNA maturation factor [Labrys wisconsinensis]
MTASDDIAIDIAWESPLWQRLADAGALVERAVAAAVRTGGLAHAPGAELSLVLTDDAAIAGINAAWRGKDKPTNVLSFPAAPASAIARSPLLGDIVLAYETLDREAAEAGLALADHFTHLVVHGFLHLFGYDHESDAEAEVMEALETRVLAGLGIADPYAEAPALRAAG